MLVQAGQGRIGERLDVPQPVLNQHGVHMCCHLDASSPEEPGHAALYGYTGKVATQSSIGGGGTGGHGDRGSPRGQGRLETRLSWRLRVDGPPRLDRRVIGLRGPSRSNDFRSGLRHLWRGGITASQGDR